MPSIKVENFDLSEKDYWEKGYRDNYGYFLKWGGIYSWWTAMIYFIGGGAHILFFIYTAYLKMDDIERLTESLHFAFFILVVGPNTAIGIIYRKTFDILYTAIGKGFYDYEGTLTEKCIKEKTLLLNRAQKIKHFLSKSYITLVMIACMALCFARPVADFIMDMNAEQENFNGIVTHSIAIICWYPLDTRDPINFYIVAICQYVCILITPGVVFEMAISFLCFSEELCAQLDIVSLGMKYCRERAKMLMETNQNLKFEECIRICLNHSVRHHLLMIKLFYDFQKIYSHVLFILLIGSTFLLCLCGVNFMAPTVSMNSKAYFGMFIIAEVANIFIYCYYGELIRQKANYAGFALYDSSWTDDPNILKVYLLVVPARCERPLSLSACGFMDASLNTFTNVLSSSYSYFNLLNLLSS